jgi:hypothetical protein
MRGEQKGEAGAWHSQHKGSLMSKLTEGKGALAGELLATPPSWLADRALDSSSEGRGERGGVV